MQPSRIERRDIDATVGLLRQLAAAAAGQGEDATVPVGPGLLTLAADAIELLKAPAIPAGHAEAAFDLRNAVTDMEHDLIQLQEHLEEAQAYRKRLDERHQQFLEAFEQIREFCGDRPTTREELVAFLKAHPRVVYSTWERGNVPRTLEFERHGEGRLYFLEPAKLEPRRGPGDTVEYAPQSVSFASGDCGFGPDGFRIYDYYRASRVGTHLFRYEGAPADGPPAADQPPADPARD
jgi:hypothetical protein